MSRPRKPEISWVAAQVNRRPLWTSSAMWEPPRLPVGPAKREPTTRTALLINPFYPKDPHGSFGKHVLTPSLALTSVAAATPPEWQVQVWDENLLQGLPPADPPPEVAGITVHVAFADRAYALARWLRARGTKVILGGLHVLACPDEAACHADAIALGEGVQLWPRILEDVAQGQLQPRYEAAFDTALDSEPTPRRDLLPKGSFLTPLSVVATRGCKNRCGFCYLSTRGLRMPLRVRTVDSVCREIGESNRPYVVFLDNNLGSDPEYLRALCRGLERLRIIWSAAVTLDVTDDRSLVKAMARSGCTGVFIGFESLTDENLSEAHKRSPKARDYGERIQCLHDVGIQVNGSFVVGFDHDRPEVFEELSGWIEQVRLECATFHILTPYPGTPLFRQMEEEGRLLHRDWSRYDTAHAVYQPRHMSPEELELGYDALYRRQNTLASIWVRRPANVGAAVPYLAMSLLYRRMNRWWPFLIRQRWVHAAWRPLVAVSRWRHLRQRHRWAEAHAGWSVTPAPIPVLAQPTEAP